MTDHPPAHPPEHLPDPRGAHGGDPLVEHAVAPVAPALSIAFTREEVVVLSELAQLRLPLLGDRPLGGVDPGVRDVITASARRSLLARGVAARGDDGVRVARAALALLEIVAAGSLRVTLDQTDRTGTHVSRRVWFAVPHAAVEVWVDLDDNLRFLPFATADLLTRVLGHTQIVDGVDSAGTRVQVPHGAWVSARREVRADRPGEAVQVLAEAGVAESPAGSLVHALQRARSTWAVQLVHHPSASTTAGGEVAWLDAGKGGVWSVPTLDQPFASTDVRVEGWFGGPAEGHEPLTDDRDPDLATLPVDVRAVARQELIDVLQSFLPGTD